MLLDVGLTKPQVKVWYHDPTPNYYLGMVLSFNKPTGGHNIQFKDGEFVRYLDNERSWYLVDQSLQEKLTKKLGLSVPGKTEGSADAKSTESGADATSTEGSAVAKSEGAIQKVEEPEKTSTEQTAKPPEQLSATLQEQKLESEKSQQSSAEVQTQDNNNKQV